MNSCVREVGGGGTRPLRLATVAILTLVVSRGLTAAEAHRVSFDAATDVILRLRPEIWVLTVNFSPFTGGSGRKAVPCARGANSMASIPDGYAVDPNSRNAFYTGLDGGVSLLQKNSNRELVTRSRHSNTYREHI